MSEWLDRALAKAAEWRRKKDEQKKFRESGGSSTLPARRTSDGHYEYVAPNGGATLVSTQDSSSTPAPTPTRRGERHSRLTDWELEHDK